MKYSMIGILAMVFALSACGGGTAANNAPAPANTGGTAQDNTGPEDKPEDKPEEEPQPDPNAHRNVSGTTPSGWHSMAKPGITELQNSGFLKAPSGGLEWLTGISTPKVPGPTEGDEEWNEWRDHMSAASLYYAGEPGQDLVSAMKSAGGKLIDGFNPETVVKDGALAGGATDDGRYVYMAFSNKLGTYVVVGVLASGENHDSNGQAVIAWAESIKPKS